MDAVSTGLEPTAGRRCPPSALALALVLALAPAAAGGELRFENVGAEQGLSNLSVRALAQDGDGFLWIGTQEGLDRFDGTTMRVFRHDPGDPSSLAANRISALLVDHRGRLWVGTRGGGLCRYEPDGERFVTYRPDPDDPAALAQGDIYALAEDREGQLWIGTSRAGVDRLEESPQGARFIHHRHAEDDPASLADDRTRSLLVTRDGSLWVGTMGGLDHLVDASGRFAHYAHDPARPESLADDEVWALTEDRSGALWVGTWGGGLARLDPGDVAAGRFRAYAHDPADRHSLPSDTVMLVAEDAAGRLWVGTLGGGVAELPAAERSAARPRFLVHRPDPTWGHGLAGSEVVDLLEDRDGDLWFATSGGVSRLDRGMQGVDSHRPAPDDPQAMPADTVSAVAEDGGRLWFGSRLGLHRVTPSQDPFTPDVVETFAHGDRPGSPPAGEVSSLRLDRHGVLWVGTLGGGLAALPAAERSRPEPRFVVFGADEGDPGALASDAILSLFEDAAGRMWVGTYRGLHRVVPAATLGETRFVRYRHDANEERAAVAPSIRPASYAAASLSSDRIQALAQCPDGSLWVGTYNGLNRLDPTTGAILRYLPSAREPGSLSYEFVRSLACDGAGRVWAGTWGGGLDRLDPGSNRFRIYGVGDGLPSETLEDIAVDGSGGLWLATPRGLVRFAPARGVQAVLGETDGLLDSEVGLLQRLADGRLIVGSAGGFVVVPPGWPPVPSPPPRALLAGLRVRNQPVVVAPGGLLERVLTRTPRLVLGPRQDLVTFELSALAFRRSSTVRLAYRMEGLDAAWTATDSRRATYSQLPPGSYHLRVRATADGGGVGVAGEPEAQPGDAVLAVDVLPPWWRTWWAQGAALTLVAAAAFAWHRGRLRVLSRRNLLLERRVAERTADLAAANRELELASRTDVLTGLPNRRDFLERAAREVVAFRRSGRPFAIVLGDIDHFKRVNDSWGHDVGDLVLREVAAAVRLALREGDLVARWGGEELIFLLPDTALDAACAVADRLRAQVAAADVRHGSERIPVTMTLGVCAIGGNDTLDDCVRHADAALYEGKRAGRNRVTAVVASGETAVDLVH